MNKLHALPDIDNVQTKILDVAHRLRTVATASEFMLKDYPWLQVRIRDINTKLWSMDQISRDLERELNILYTDIRLGQDSIEICEAGYVSEETVNCSEAGVCRRTADDTESYEVVLCKKHDDMFCSLDLVS